MVIHGRASTYGNDKRHGVYDPEQTRSALAFMLEVVTCP